MKECEFYKHKIMGVEHFWFRARSEIVDGVLDNILFDGKRRALEIGIGTGNMLGCIKKCGFGKVDGVEVHKVSGARGYERIYWGPFEKMKAGCKYGAVFMFDSLEHIKDDEIAVAKAGRMLAKNGLIVITAPAYQWLWSRHDEDNMHFRRYDKKQLGDLLERNGFSLVRITYFNTILFPLIVIARALNKGGLEKINPLLNEILYRIFGLEKYALKLIDLPYGASLIAVARKR